jgi:hypothetical protein
MMKKVLKEFTGSWGLSSPKISFSHDFKMSIILAKFPYPEQFTGLKSGIK